MKKTLATVAVAVSAVGMAGAAAAPAMAVEDQLGPISNNGNASDQIYGNTTTSGKFSPNFALINGSLNKPCIAVPLNSVDVQNVVGLVNVGIQDLLTQKQNQTCAENSSSVQGDAPLSHLLNGLGVLGYNGVDNG
ncbi:rodlin [Streptomyces sp. NPDC059853]|uniref:rodlin n=1 Tax=Streptomyces sp. NPDC059853 TaxID=3346973 RepID=UPI00365034DA